MTAVPARKPRVIGIVILLLLRGILTLVVSFSTLGEINANPELWESWAQPYYYGVIVLSILMIVGGVLTAMYRRAGLMLGLATTIIDLIASVILLIALQFAPNLLYIVISLAILYYCYKYLTSEPDKSFFT
jgi:hypothetical protein